MAHFINESILNTILGWFGGALAADHWLGFAIAALVHVTLLIGLVATAALLFIWLERKISGRIQDRLGPTRVGGKFGWLQTLADGLKLLTKEDLMPADADRLLFKIAPYVSFCAAFAVFLALPFSSGSGTISGGTVAWVGQHLNVATFFVLAVLGLEVFGVILAGYGSASKWSLFGAMREAAQVVSYEVPLGLGAVVPVMIAGTMDLVAIGNMQQGWFTNWLVLHDPFAFLAFCVFFVCATASVNRAPFDLAEAESELVAGFHTEYSGLRWSFFFMAEYGSMLSTSILASLLFLGAWNGPLPLAHWLGLGYENGPLWGYLGSLLGCLNVLAKGVLGVSVMIWARWTLPRLRIDQVITTCWKYCTPIVCFAFIGTTVWMLWLPQGLGLLPSSGPYARIHEAAVAQRRESGATSVVARAGAESLAVSFPSPAVTSGTAPAAAPTSPAMLGNALNDSSARNSRCSGRRRSRETSEGTVNGPNSHEFGYQNRSRRCMLEATR